MVTSYLQGDYKATVLRQAQFLDRQEQAIGYLRAQKQRRQATSSLLRYD
jgi:hypothetical protein